MQGHREYMEDVYIQGKVGCPLRNFEVSLKSPSSVDFQGGHPNSRCLGAICTPFLTVTEVPQLLGTVNVGLFTTGKKSGKSKKCPTNRQMMKSKNLSSTFCPTSTPE